MKEKLNIISISCLFAIIFIFGFGSQLTAQSSTDYEIIKKANKAYVDGNFSDAVEMYEKLVNAGFSAPELFYNLANSYYRLADYKSAILYYEKALLLNPDDENTKINLEFSQRYIQDKIEAVPQFFLISWGESIVNLFAEKTWAIFSISTFILFLVGIILFLFTKVIIIRKLSFYVGILSIFISLFSFYFAYQQKQDLTSHNTAIVFVPSVTVKSSPNESGTDLFIIHEGLKVSIIGKSNGWKEIKLSDGKVGWLRNESVAEI